MSLVERFEAMLSAGQDSALLRFTLGSEYLKAGDARRAGEHLEAAVGLDPAYSAAWKLLGKARDLGGDREGARVAFLRGIDVATAKGDKQSAREMGVFLKRLNKPA